MRGGGRGRQEKAKTSHVALKNSGVGTTWGA